MRDKKKTRINEHIRVPSVRLIDQDGNQVGIVSAAEAMAEARKASMDLVEISPNVEPPVCRIMDYGKYIFDHGKKKTQQKKHQRQTQVKEIKFRPVTDVSDFRVKMRRIYEFLERGDKVKVSLRFRGREVQHQALGMEFIDRVKTELPPNVVVEQEAKLEGRQIIMMLAPGKK